MSSLNGSARVTAERHLAHFYPNKRDLAETVARHIVEALESGGKAVAVATPGHLRAFEPELRRAGVDVAAAREAGSYVTFDAERMARRVINEGRLDSPQLDAMHAEINGPAEEAGTGLFVYGETAALVWDAGLVDAALELEARTNELIADVDVTVMCGYRLQSTSGPRKLAFVRQLCLHHAYLTSLPFSR